MKRASEMTKMAAIMGEEIVETGDFVVNEKDKVVNLTEQGVKKVEKFFHIENLCRSGKPGDPAQYHHWRCVPTT